MDYQETIRGMSEATYRSLKRAVELGKWPNGEPLSAKQRETTLQAVIAWGELHLDKVERVGYIDKKHKEGDVCDSPEETPISWKD